LHRVKPSRSKEALWIEVPERAETSGAAMDVETASGAAAMVSGPLKKEGFQWRKALSESFTFLVIEQAYVAHTDFNWVVSKNGVPFNHFWRDYKQSLSEWIHSRWNDGDPNWFGYVGHPIQGALTGFIQIQNDPQGERLEFSKTKAYWRSRFKAALWNTAYSTLWNLGPLGEVSPVPFKSETSFAEALGGGADFRLMPLLSWRICPREWQLGSSGAQATFSAQEGSDQ
jgi:hypothetical protein